MLFFCKCLAFVYCYVICLAAFDLILRIVPGGVMGVSLIVEILRVDLYDRTGYDSRFGVPFYMVAYFKSLRHIFLF